ncbi:hypothetical protein M0812_25784 [Anaeramoeba flamelloides]|uniref:THH1/TOM1/TOM3 domain-containing protein n=1 Tax=Anaeramoeba flamelloides TaxID=1746091 RepID=A0AAV7YHR9_9EUKA|nr:hypothetical protein M0812_25784 [Anaeramoeba flamelloides]
MGGLELAVRGSCRKPGTSSTEPLVQCLCLSTHFTFYRWLSFVLSISVFLCSSYILFLNYSLTKKKKEFRKLIRLRVLGLVVVLTSSLVSIFYYGVDPHNCNFKLGDVVESVLYGIMYYLSSVLMIMIILRWIDLCKKSFSVKKSLFRPTVQRFFKFYISFSLIMELFCRVWWSTITYYLYSIYFTTFSIFIFVGFLIFGTRLFKSLNFGKKFASGLLKQRKKQIKTSFTISVLGSVLAIVVIIELIISMLINCWVSTSCSISFEWLWRLQMILFDYYYLAICIFGTLILKKTIQNNHTKKVPSKNTDIEDPKKSTRKLSTTISSNSEDESISNFSPIEIKTTSKSLSFDSNESLDNKL